MIEQEIAAAKVYRREPDDSFRLDIIEGLNSTIELPAIAAALEMSAIYANVKFTIEADQ